MVTQVQWLASLYQLLDQVYKESDLDLYIFSYKGDHNTLVPLCSKSCTCLPYVYKQ